MSDLESIANEVQKQIMEEIKQQYSPKVIDSWKHPQNWGIMPQADGYAKITGPCGDTMEISIVVRTDTITKCTFDTDGCGATIACGSMITEMVAGKSLAEAAKIGQAELLEYCGGLPEENTHCALLAANTLQAAIKNFRQNRQSPWKKHYQKN
jgi:nitrogen fixation NifU-like protein